MSLFKKAWLPLTVILMMSFIGVSSSNAAVTLGENEYLVFYHHDALGSPAAATDENGNILWREASRPFGKSAGKSSGTGQPLVESDGADNENRLGFTGHTFDCGSDLVYMKARFYDPAIGRFNSNDPLGYRQSDRSSFNRYSYANNNPIRYIDPAGLSTGTTGVDEFPNGTRMSGTSSTALQLYKGHGILSATVKVRIMIVPLLLTR